MQFRLELARDEVNAKNSIFSSLIQTVGSLFFVVTAILTYRNVKATEDKQISERFSKAVEQLGESSKLEVRLGGIYSLEHIAQDSSQDEWTIIEVLTAFVRRNRPLFLPANNTIDIDIQAALTTISRSAPDKALDHKFLDLSYTHLVRAKLNRAKFKKANLESSNLTRVELRQADLSGANLWNTILEHADLTGANLTGASLVNTVLTGCNLLGAKGLTPQQVTNAYNWEYASFSPEFENILRKYVQDRSTP
jgi:hypothetical protein